MQEFFPVSTASVSMAWTAADASEMEVPLADFSVAVSLLQACSLRTGVCPGLLPETCWPCLASLAAERKVCGGYPQEPRIPWQGCCGPLLVVLQVQHRAVLLVLPLAALSVLVWVEVLAQRLVVFLVPLTAAVLSVLGLPPAVLSVLVCLAQDRILVVLLGLPKAVCLVRLGDPATCP